ncbi:alkylated DNA repair dioxygenase AlkB [Paraburkholderia sp. BL6665CI2N2]|uniref:alpha-ketoglutarate-dependent dioxygenase AlkB n=1 Tax=Paraburkholderia sp. BL6665CI2N2 TaxID=1938806 RepID=UPI001065565E|nr:alpha-ketoglutarate-dependent dioxygenase AlkB [Paraburkholderia sp. BL6665CI2N2]TDY22040.1 alkylated DNA repair dioxygenase AlkB [Paraburkholderia sp. BL6665CI2N2]
MTFQRCLFEEGPLSVVQDDEGGVRYLPGAVNASLAEHWFKLLIHNAQWATYRRMMYEREVAVPRLTAGYWDDGKSELPEPLVEAFAQMRSLVGAPFNSVGLNLYRGENDSVAPHGDKVEKLAVGQPIAVLSLGATRRMSIRSRHGPGRVAHIDLEAGSVSVMSYESQLTHEHGIPKMTARCGPRISLAFGCFDF